MYTLARNSEVVLFFFCWLFFLAGVYSNGTKKALKRLCDTGEVLFDLPIAGYDKLEVKFCADNDDSVASGIAGGLVLYKNGKGLDKYLITLR